MGERLVRVGSKMLELLQKLIVPLLVLIFGQLMSINQEIGSFKGELNGLMKDIEDHWAVYDKAVEHVADLKIIILKNSDKITEMHDDVTAIGIEQLRRTDTINYMEAVKNAGGWPLVIEKEPKK